MNREDARILPIASVGLAQGLWRYYIRPEITAKRTWAIIGAVVVAHEIVCPPGELLSEGADRAIEKHPWLPLVGGIIFGHVVNAFREDRDLIHIGLKAFKSISARPDLYK